MEDSDKIFFRIYGDNITKESISFFDVALYIERLSQALKSEGEYKGLDIDDIMNEITLDSVQEGSLLLGLLSKSDKAMAIALGVCMAFASMASPIKEVNSFIKYSVDLSHKYNASISCLIPALEDKPFELCSPKSMVKEIRHTKIRELSWVYGTLIKIGGKNDPKATFEGFDKKLFSGIIDRDMARALAPHLYGDRLVLHGEITYAMSDVPLFDSIDIKEFYPMVNTGIADAVMGLKRFLGSDFENIGDITEYIESIRRSDEHFS